MANSNAVPTPRATARRSAILAIAWEIFLRDGYAATSMSDIAGRLGGSKGTLYNYFASKKELFLAVVQEKGEEVYAKLADLSGQSANLPDVLTKYGREFLRIVLSEEFLAFYRLIVAEATRFPEIGAVVYDYLRGTLLVQLGRRLEREMQTGRLRTVDPLDAAELFWDLCSASLHRRWLLGVAPQSSAEEIPHLIDRAVSVFMAAYALPADAKRG